MDVGLKVRCSKVDPNRVTEPKLIELLEGMLVTNEIVVNSVARIPMLTSTSV